MFKSPDAWDTFDRIQDFPFPETAFFELKRYVRSVHEFLPHISEQQTVRIEAQLAAESDPVSIGELKSNLQGVREDGSELLPRLLWGGVLVSTYAAFEFGVGQVLKHWQTTVRNKPRFVQERGDFLIAAERYAQHYLKISLFSSAEHRRVISQLKGLRNSFVHKGSKVATLPKDLRAALEQQEHIGLSLERADECWIANARAAVFFLLRAEEVVRAFSHAALDRCLVRN
jgi:hypothetical protein